MDDHKGRLKGKLLALKIKRIYDFQYINNKNKKKIVE